MGKDNLKIILAGEKSRFAGFAESLEQTGSVHLSYETSGTEVLKALTQGPCQIVAIDEKLDDMEGLALANRIAEQHPFVNTALAATSTADDFHEETEGLGVLMQLASPPDAQSAVKLIEHYRSIWG